MDHYCHDQNESFFLRLLGFKMRVRRFANYLICFVAFMIAASWLGIISSMRTDWLDETEVIDQQFAKMIQQASDRKSRELEIFEFPIEDAKFEQVIKLPWLETLILDQGVLTDSAVKRLNVFDKLRHLRLRMSPITDEGMRSISEVKSLWYLNLPHAECTSVGVEYLQSLPSLRQLRLGSPELGNEVAESISKIESLRSVHLIGVPIDDEGAKILASLPNLQSLYLDDSEVSEEGWEWLFNEAPHLHIHVNQKHHDRDPEPHEHGSELGSCRMVMKVNAYS